MGKKSTPAAPDYTKLAEMTAQSSQQAIDPQTTANRVNQINPWGNMTWSQGTDASGKPNGQWTQTTTLSPEQQQQLDAQNQISKQKNQIATTLLPRMQQEYGQGLEDRESVV